MAETAFPSISSPLRGEIGRISFVPDTIPFLSSEHMDSRAWTEFMDTEAENLNHNHLLYIGTS